MGVAVGDYNGDGFPDLMFLSTDGASFTNNGDGTFTDVTEKAGVATPGWSSSAVWFDYDNDGKLDLFVCRFVDFDKSKNKFCGDEHTRERYYCIPRVYDPMPSWLFHNTVMAHSVMCRRNRALAEFWEKRGGLSQLMSTTMAGWTCSSPMTPSPISFL